MQQLFFVPKNKEAKMTKVVETTIVFGLSWMQKTEPFLKHTNYCSTFYNYEGPFSMVLMALVGANYNFIYAS